VRRNLIFSGKKKTLAMMKLVSTPDKGVDPSPAAAREKKRRFAGERDNCECIREASISNQE